MADTTRKTEKLIIAIVISLLLAGTVIIIFFGLSHPFNDGSFQRDPELFGLFGNFIGGFVGTLFSLVAAILLYLALVEQRKATFKQDEHFRQDQFESTFFNLLKSQSDITEGVYSVFSTLNERLNIANSNVKGRLFFAYARIELKLIFDSINDKSYRGIYEENDDLYWQHIDWEIDQINSSNNPEYVNQIEAKQEEHQIRYGEKKRLANKLYNITKETWEEVKNEDLKKQMAKA